MRSLPWVLCLSLVACRFERDGVDPRDLSPPRPDTARMDRAISDRSSPDGPLVDRGPGDGLRSDRSPRDATRDRRPSDGKPAGDAKPSDGPKTDAAPLCSTGKVHCGGTCVTATDCSACSSGKLLCRPMRACFSTCATCFNLSGQAVPIECYACDTSQNNPIGTCEPNSGGSYCLNANYSTAYKGGAGQHCDCSNTVVANCVGSQHVCKPAGSTDWCITCGETGLATNGLACKGGGTCNTSLSPPRCQ